MVTGNGFARLRRFVEENLWSRAPLRPAPLGWLRGVVQLGIVIGQGFVRDQLLLRAHALTYLSMLSIVPLLALMVTFADLVGMRDQVSRLIEEQVGAAVPQAGEWLLRFVEELDFGALGTVSSGVLIASTILAIGGAERALNAIWGVQKQRSWARRIPDYLAVLVVAPIFVGVAIPLGASLQSQWFVQRMISVPGFETIYLFALAQAPAILMFVAFSFLYWFLPNTEVRPASALLGGAVGGVLFSLVQKAYVGFQVGAAKYNAIFGTFAALPLFMVWMYISWAIVLLGAEVAYAHQTLARYRREVRGTPAGPAAREALGLAIALQVARAFHEGRSPWTTEALSEALDVPLRTVREVMGQLEEASLVRATQEEGDPGYQLGRPAERIRVEDVLAALRGPRETPVQLPEVARVIGKVFEDIDRETHLAAEASSLRDLVEQLPAEEAEEGAAVATGPAREVPA